MLSNDSSTVNPALVELARRELARRFYADYLAYTYGDSWVKTRMSAYLAERIQSFIETDTGYAYDILIIECPPQHGKSMTVSESLPSWYLGRHPENNLILASYDSDFAERFCRKNKDKIKSCGRNLFEPLSHKDDAEAAAFATAEVRNLLEKFKMDYRIRDALFDGAITGDYAAHFYWNPLAQPYGGAFGAAEGEIEMELVDGINVMFGNPNSHEVEKQPYILVVGRGRVDELKAEAEQYRKRKKWHWQYEHPGEEYVPEPINISADHDMRGFTGAHGNTDLNGNDEKYGTCLYVYMYTKEWKSDYYDNPKTGKVEVKRYPSVHVTKATRDCIIYEDIDTGLSRYPIAFGNWQRQKNQYHGRALVTEIIPNQIFINQMMAMVFRHLQTQAFPTKVFNADLLPAISNEVGTAIGVKNLLPGQPLADVITTIPASNMSAQIIQAIELCMQYTRECLGATDAQMGNVRPDNTSALMVLQNASEVPLENTRAGLHEWIEDIGAILLDMMGNYYGKRPVVHEKEVEEPVLGADGQPLIDPMTGQPATVKARRRVVEDFDFSIFRHLWLNVSVDVGATTYYSEIAMVQTLDNLRRDGTLDIIQYLERMPDKLITRKQELIDSIKNSVNLSQGPAEAAQKGGNEYDYIVGGELDAAKKIASLPTAMQARYDSLPKAAQRVLTK